MAKIVVGGTDASPTYTKVATTLTDNIVTGATAALGVLSDDQTTFYDKKAMGTAAAVNLAAGIVIGDKFGDKIPVLGGRR